MSIARIALLSAVIAATLATSGFAADAAAGAASEPAVQKQPLWDKTPNVVEGKDTDTDPTEPTIEVFLPKQESAGATTAGVIVLPGGGYSHLAAGKEGRDVAKFFNDHHIAAFVVRYRHAPRYHYPVPVEDAQRAVRLVRSRAEEYHIDSHHLGIMGFSAGGHLAATVATATAPTTQPASGDAVDQLSARPDFAILIYPVITFVDPSMHKGSRTALVGDDEKLWQELSAENRVTPQTPPVILVHSAVDTSVPVKNSILFFEACLKNHVPVEMHIFPVGRHGFGLAADNPFLDEWPELVIHWMKANKWTE